MAAADLGEVPDEVMNEEGLPEAAEIQEEMKRREAEVQMSRKRQELRAAYIESYRLQDEYDELSKLLEIRKRLEQ